MRKEYTFSIDTMFTVTVENVDDKSTAASEVEAIELARKKVIEMAKAHELAVVIEYEVIVPNPIVREFQYVLLETSQRAIKVKVTATRDSDARTMAIRGEGEIIDAKPYNVTGRITHPVSGWVWAHVKKGRAKNDNNNKL